MSEPELEISQANTTAMKGPGCPYCGAVSVPYVSAPDRNRKVSNAIYSVNACVDCGLKFIINPPRDLGKYYNFDYHARPQSVSDMNDMLPAHRYKIEILKRFMDRGLVLEIGPSTGIFCWLAKKSGFDVSAIEMDVECAEFLNRKLEVPTTCSAEPEKVLASSTLRYDAICMWHVIEHVPEPWSVFVQAARHLAPGGVLIIAAPNPDSTQTRYMGSRWAHYDLPRHLFHIPISWLLKLAGREGLAPELVTTRDEGGLFFNRFSWAMLFQSLSGGSRMRARLWQLGTAFGYLMQPWEGREGKGATYTIVLRRPLE